jgi:RNA polymerase sigma-B factor
VTWRADLGELSDNALLARLRPLPPDSPERAAICEVLVERYAHLVRACVRPYRASPEPAEDLMQVGYLGLVKAIGNFDPGLGDSLPAYAAPCVSGEIKRHFRDKRWQVHVRRPLQELLLEIRAVSGELAQERGRAPADDELATLLGVTEDDIRQARQAGLAFAAASLDTRYPTPRMPRRWPSCSARTTKRSSTPSTWRPSGATWTTCPNASSGS